MRRWREFAALLSSPRLPSGLEVKTRSRKLIADHVEHARSRSRVRPASMVLTARPSVPIRASARAGEILIEVAAAGVNRPDVLQRLGKYPPPPGASDIPGLEVAGIVAALGADVAAWSVGDPICALARRRRLRGDCAAVPQEQCLPIPKGLIADRGRRHSRDVLHRLDQRVPARQAAGAARRSSIHGGTSGIGTTAIQLAQRVRRAGVRDRRAATRSARPARALGADAAFNYRTDGLGRRASRTRPAAAAST